MAIRRSLLGRAKARPNSSASAAVMPATSSMSWTTCSCHTMIPAPPLQRAGFERVVVLPLRPVPVALNELGDGAALYADAGPDEGDLVGEVQKVAGPQPLTHLELGR